MATISRKPAEGARASALASKRLRRSFGAAFAGIAAGWRGQANFRIEVVLGALALGVGLWVGADLVPILLVSALVLSLELMNTAVEATLDRVAPERHPLVKLAKDTAAAAVLVASLFAVVIGVYVLGPPLWAKLSSLLG